MQRRRGFLGHRRPSSRHVAIRAELVQVDASLKQHDRRALRWLTVVDEYTRECLAIRVARRLTSEDVLQQLTELFVARGTPACLRSDNGPELTATAVREWLARVGVTLLFIEPGSLWENGYIESFNGKLRDELLDRELFYTLAEAQILPERCRNWYDNRGRVISPPDGRGAGFIFSRLSAR